MTHRRPARKASRSPFRPHAEVLEARDVPAVVVWDAVGHPAGGDWSVGANWVGGTAPALTSDDVVIDLTAAGSVDYTANAVLAVGSVSTNALTTLNLNSGRLELSSAAPETSVFGGAVNIALSGELTAGVGTRVEIRANAIVAVVGQFTVNRTATLVADRGFAATDRSGVVVNSSGQFRADEAVFTTVGTGGRAEVLVNNSARFTGTNTAYNWDGLTFARGASARLATNAFSTTLTFESGVDAGPGAVAQNDFSAATVVAAISPSGPFGNWIVLTDNFWGTTSPAVIDGRITDRLDDPSLPLVKYDPVLIGRPVHVVTAPTATVRFSMADQTIPLAATVRSPTSAGMVIATGSVTFTVLDGRTVGTPVTVPLVAGAAAADYTLPARTKLASYFVLAEFSGAGFADTIDDTGRVLVDPGETTSATADAAVAYSAGTQTVALTATVTSPAGVVSEGEFTFSVYDGATLVGASVTGNAVNGTATVGYALPASLPPGSYTIWAYYAGSAGLSPSLDATKRLTVAPAGTTSTPADAAAVYSVGTQTVTLTATVTSPAGVVTGGTVAFTVFSGATVVGSPVAVAVTGGAATASYLLPAGLAAGAYTIAADYSGTANWQASTGDATLTVSPAGQAVVFQPLLPVVYGVGPLTLVASGGGSGNPVAFTVVSGPGTVSGGTLAVTGAGTVVVRATQAGTGNYSSAAGVERSLIVAQAPLTLTARDAFGTAGQPLPLLGFRADGLVNGDTDAVVVGATVTTPGTATSAVGNYAILITGGTAANYTLTRVNGTLKLTAPPTLPPVVVPPIVPPIVPPVVVPPVAPPIVPPVVVPPVVPPIVPPVVPPIVVPPVVTPVVPPATPVQALQGTPLLAVGSGGGPTVRVYNPDGTVRARYQVFDVGFTGGVRTATADFAGNGGVQIVAGAGPGISNRVRVLDGATGKMLADFQPFEAGFSGGVFVAVGDLNGDGAPDVVVTPDQTGGPVVVVYDGAGLAGGRVRQLARFLGIDDPAFRGGARAAVGVVQGDVQVIVAAGFGGGPRVAVFDGADVAAGAARPRRALPDFFAFESGLRNGADVAAGDVTGGGSSDLIFGAGPGGGPRVRVVNAAQLIAAAGTFRTLDDVPAARVADFFAGDPDDRGGVRVAVKRLDATNRAGLVVGSGTGAGSRVTAYTGAAIVGSATPSPLLDFEESAGGVFVG